MQVMSQRTLRTALTIKNRKEVRDSQSFHKISMLTTPFKMLFYFLIYFFFLARPCTWKFPPQPQRPSFWILNWLRHKGTRTLILDFWPPELLFLFFVCFVLFVVFPLVKFVSLFRVGTPGCGVILVLPETALGQALPSSGLQCCRSRGS